MLDLQQKIVDGLKYEYMEYENVTIPVGVGKPLKEKRQIIREVTGREIFYFFFEQVHLWTAKDMDEVHGYRNYLCKEGISVYDLTSVPTYFDHYFRHLYKIVQFVDSQDFEFDEAYRYVSFLRGTLSRYELVWLYYNTLNPEFDKFKNLIEKYSMLKGVRSGLLTRTKEVDSYCQSLGILDVDMKKKGFSGKDFEFYLTDKECEKGKYHVSAFWNKKDIDEGKAYLHRWRTYINEQAGKIIKGV